MEGIPKYIYIFIHQKLVAIRKSKHTILNIIHNDTEVGTGISKNSAITTMEKIQR